MSELKPCPFCGGQAQRLGTKWVTCDHSPECPGKVYIALPEEWNRRAPRFTTAEQAFWDAAKEWFALEFEEREVNLGYAPSPWTSERQARWMRVRDAYRAMLAEGGKDE